MGKLLKPFRKKKDDSFLLLLREQARPKVGHPLVETRITFKIF
jgi:hypothetical protein